MIMDDLAPLEELVSISCLRLPNDLHKSVLMIYSSLLDNETNKNKLDYDRLEPTILATQSTLDPEAQNPINSSPFYLYVKPSTSKENLH